MQGEYCWDKFWRETELSLEDNKRIIKDELNSLKWKRIKQRLIDKFSSILGLNVIEIGSGRGEISVLMAQEQARASLLDKSKYALGLAEDLFKKFGLQVNLIESDIFSLPSSLEQQFDVSMSFGLVEHFTFPRRQEAFDIHYRLLKPGGISVISVPNMFCPAYWPLRLVAQATGHWKIGFELPFRLGELFRCAEKAGFKKIEILGSCFIYDTLHFLVLQPLFHILGKNAVCGLRFEIPSKLDRLFGAYLTLIGEK